MKKLHELLNLPKVDGCKVGIEIECEGNGILVTQINGWRSEDDGSLRGAYPSQRHEFVSGILDVEEVGEKLDALIKEQRAAVFDFSFRTSTHVHINVLDMSPEEVTAFVFLYYLVEKDIMKYCGEFRNNNRFCLRMVDSEFQLDILKGVVAQGFKEVRFVVDENMRYAACNMAALVKYGTLEFRGMRGTMDKEVLMNWIGILSRLRELSIEIGSAYKLFQQATANVDEFAEWVYGPFAGVFLNNDTRQCITEALSLSVEIPFLAHRVQLEEQERAKRHKDPAPKANEILMRLVRMYQEAGWSPHDAQVNAEASFRGKDHLYRLAEEQLRNHPLKRVVNQGVPAVIFDDIFDQPVQVIAF